MKGIQLKSAVLGSLAIGAACTLAATPAGARFLQVDPVGYKDQINLYAYVNNDPLNRFDPNGRDGQWVHDRNTGVTTLVIPVYFKGSSATPSVTSAIANRVEGLNIPNANYKIDVVVLSGPGGKGTNTLDLSPGSDFAKYPVAGEGINKLGGNNGHINSSNASFQDAAAHDTLHFVGVKDQYTEGPKISDGSRGPSIPNAGYNDSNIMTARSGTELRNSQFEQAKSNQTTEKCTIKVGETGGC